MLPRLQLLTGGGGRIKSIVLGFYHFIFKSYINEYFNPPICNVIMQLFIVFLLYNIIILLFIFGGYFKPAI